MYTFSYMIEQSFPPKEFNWDNKNIDKNWKKHKVRFSECEEMFFNEPLVITTVDKDKFFYSEDRYIAYGKTNSNRLFFVVFTIRERKIRVISVRDMNRKERGFYYEETKKADTVQK